MLTRLSGPSLLILSLSLTAAATVAQEPTTPVQPKKEAETGASAGTGPVTPLPALLSPPRQEFLPVPATTALAPAKDRAAAKPKTDAVEWLLKQAEEPSSDAKSPDPKAAPEVPWLLGRGGPDKGGKYEFPVLAEGMVRQLDAPEVKRWELTHPYLAFALVFPGSSLHRAGIREGDVLLQMDDKEIRTGEDLSDQLGRHKTGDRVAVVVLRRGQRRSKTLVLGTTTVTEREAVALVQSRAAAGDPYCCFFLGMLHLRGSGVVQDSTEAYRWIRQAAERGLSSAQVRMALRWWNGSDFTRDRDESVGWLWLAAELGNIEALNAAGNLLTMGKVVPADHGTAYRYFRTAAEAGCPLCQGIVGAIHAGFRPTQANTREAMRWLRLSAENGRADAALLLARRYRFGLGVPVDPREAARFYLLAANGGEAEAYSALACLYLTGSGVSKDVVEGARWARRAAEAGNGEWQCVLAIFYLKGQGVAENPVEAVRWLLEAGCHGHAGAQAFLGMLYMSGKGLIPDAGQALECFHRSARQGDQTGQLFLGAAYRYGWADQAIDGRRAAELFRQSSYQGNPSALRELALCYRHGIGVQRDSGRGRELLRRAAQKQDADAGRLQALLASPIVRWCPALRPETARARGDRELSEEARLLHAEERRAGQPELLGARQEGF